MLGHRLAIGRAAFGNICGKSFRSLGAQLGAQALHHALARWTRVCEQRLHGGFHCRVHDQRLVILRTRIALGNFP